jgi:hypothetical protein
MDRGKGRMVGREPGGAGGDHGLATCRRGFTDEAAFRTAHEAMLSLPVVESPLGAGVFEEAVAL